MKYYHEFECVRHFRACSIFAFSSLFEFLSLSFLFFSRFFSVSLFTFFSSNSLFPLPLSLLPPTFFCLFFTFLLSDEKLSLIYLKFLTKHFSKFRAWHISSPDNHSSFTPTPQPSPPFLSLPLYQSEGQSPPLTANSTLICFCSLGAYMEGGRAPLEVFPPLLFLRSPSSSQKLQMHLKKKERTEECTVLSEM